MKPFAVFSLCVFIALSAGVPIASVTEYSQEIYQVQKALKARGYNPGIPDGLWGQSTEAAVKRFQRDSGLPITGELDEQTRDRLGLASENRSIIRMSKRRIALVVGNGSYRNAQLVNPANDATDMAAALERCGFRVDKKINVSQETLEDAIREFGSKLNEGIVGLFYYSGHGVQVFGHNYLIPIGARIIKEKDVKYKAVDLSQVLDEMGAARNGLNIVILDACRDNPLERSWRSKSHGLTRVEGPKGTLIAYSTSPGSVAEDGEGRNGTYTKNLLRVMNIPGLPVEQVFKKVLQAVDRETGGKQTPWISSSFTGDFYFASIGGPGPKPLISHTAEREKLERERLELERLRLEIDREKLEAERKRLEEEQLKATVIASAASKDREIGQDVAPFKIPISLFDTRVVFRDDFDDNSHNWPEIESKKAYTKISSGKYTIQHKRKTGSWMETIPVEFEQWEDFTIESTITKSSGTSKHGYGLIWGCKDAKNYYCFFVSIDGKYYFGKQSSGKWTTLIKWKKSKHIKTGNSKNKFTIRKKGLTYEFLMNDKRVDGFAVESFFGYKIGFLVNLNMKIRVHDITVTGKRTIPQIYNIVKAEAAKGNPYHQALLGDAYRRGYPFKEDDPEGERLIKLAAEKGHPFGLYELANFYDDDENNEHDKEKAEALYRETLPGIRSMAEAGDAFAQTCLGDIYYKGYGIGKDFKQAKVWFEKAAAQGQFRSRMMVGLLYGKGEGVKKDYRKAMTYFLNEARKGYYIAQYDVGVFYDFGLGVKKDMKVAKKWYERAIAVNDYHMALNNLARFYQWGYGGTKIDKAKARDLFKRAAEAGNDKAAVNYAAMVKNGEGG